MINIRLHLDNHKWDNYRKNCNYSSLFSFKMNNNDIFTFSRVLWCQIVLINRCHREVILLPHQRGGIHYGVTGAVLAETEVAAILEKLLNPGFPTCLSHHNIYHPLNPLHNVQKRIRVEVSNNVGLIPIKCAYDFNSIKSYSSSLKIAYLVVTLICCSPITIYVWWKKDFDWCDPGKIFVIKFVLLGQNPPIYEVIQWVQKWQIPYIEGIPFICHILCIWTTATTYWNYSLVGNFEVATGLHTVKLAQVICFSIRNYFQYLSFLEP